MNGISQDNEIILVMFKPELSIQSFPTWLYTKKSVRRWHSTSNIINGSKVVSQALNVQTPPPRPRPCPCEKNAVLVSRSLRRGSINLVNISGPKRKIGKFMSGFAVLPQYEGGWYMSNSGKDLIMLDTEYWIATFLKVKSQKYINISDLAWPEALLTVCNKDCIKPLRCLDQIKQNYPPNHRQPQVRNIGLFLASYKTSPNS